jgi:phage-related protein
MAGAKFVIAEGVLEIDADTDQAELRMKGFFRDTQGKLRNMRGRFAREGDLAGQEFGDGLERGVNRRGGLFSRLFRGLRSGASAGIGQLRELGSTLRDVGQVFSTAGGFMGSALKIGGIAALIPIILGVAAALSKLIGLLALLPGVIGFAVAAISPLIVAFQGVGEALGALMSGDMEKLNEALKKLAPSARTFVREFGQILPMLRSVKQATQEAFFAPLVGHVKVLGKDLLPTLSRGLASVAGAWGRFVAGLLDLLRTPPVLHAINELFLGTQRIIDNLAPSLLRLFGVFFKMIEKGMPFIERMFGSLGKGLDKFVTFLEEAMADGRFESWLEGAFSVMSDLWELTKSLIRLLGALFGPTADEGQTFIQNLTKMVDKLTEFFKSDEGIEFLENLVALLRESKGWLMAIASTVAFLAELNNDFIDGIAGLVKWFRNLDDVIGEWLEGTGNTISGWWENAVEWVTKLGETIGTFISEKAAAFGKWLSELPGQIYDGLVTAADTIAETIGLVIGKAVKFVLDTPERMKVGWEMLKTRAKESLDALVKFFDELPGRVTAGLSNLWSTVTAWFSSTKDSAISNTKTLADKSIEWVKGIGPRVKEALKDAASWLYDAGKNTVTGLWDGMKSMGDWIAERVKSFGSSIVKGFKRGLGIASPSKVMRDEVGRWILPGVVEGMRGGLGNLEAFMGDVQRRLTQPMVNVSAPAVAVGGPTVLVDLGDGVQRAVRTVVARNPEVVAAGTDEGRRRRSRELGARAKT